jgi:hypothetical protein
MSMAKELEKSGTKKTLTGHDLVHAVNSIFYVRFCYIFAIPKFHRIPNIRDWVLNCTDVHSRMNVTFEELLGATWSVIDAHPFRKTLRERMAEELREAMGMCFTGRMTRIVNALQGLVDGIHITVSPRERLQAAAAQIVSRKVNGVSDPSLKQELVDVLNDVPDITPAERDAWIEAFDDA